MSNPIPPSPPPCLVIKPHLQAVPFVYNVPHSGRYYPSDLLQATALDIVDLRSGEDCLVDHLFGAVAGLGACLLINSFARAYVDTNRSALELDPLIIEPPLPVDALIDSERVAVGLGVIPAVTGGNRTIYLKPLTLSAALRRIEEVYRPTHAALATLLAAAVSKFGYAVLIDCHSMPSLSMKHQQRWNDPDIVLGDRYGTSCAPALMQAAAAAFEDLGYTVVRNTPYAGGYNTAHYGVPGRGIHALQIEINRRLYLDQQCYALNDRAAAFMTDLHQAIAALHALPPETLRPGKVADDTATLPLRLSAE